MRLLFLTFSGSSLEISYGIVSDSEASRGAGRVKASGCWFRTPSGCDVDGGCGDGAIIVSMSTVRVVGDGACLRCGDAIMVSVSARQGRFRSNCRGMTRSDRIGVEVRTGAGIWSSGMSRDGVGG